MDPTLLSLTKIGRWSEYNGGLYAPTTGFRLRFKFTGTSLSITCAGGLAVQVFIDGVGQGRGAAGVFAYSELADAQHTAEFWVESVDYTAAVWAGTSGVTVTDITADSVIPWATGHPKMLVLGDSISQGLRVLDVGSVQNFHDGRQTFFQQFAASEGVEVWPMAFGDTGITVAAYGDPDALGVYPFAKSGVAQADPDMDIALIAHAANDIGVNDETFKADYATLLGLIRDDNPGIRIFCCTPITGYAADKVQTIKDVVTADAGRATHLTHPDAVLIDCQLWPSIERSPDAGHPSLAGHTTMATALKASLPYLADVPSGTKIIDRARLGTATVATVYDGAVPYTFKVDPGGNGVVETTTPTNIQAWLNQ